MSNMSFLTKDLIQFVSGTMTTSSQGDGTKINSKQFLEFGSQTDTDFILLVYGSPFSNMAQTNWVSLQSDRHIQRQKKKVYQGKHRNTKKVRVMTVWLNQTQGTFLRPRKR